MWNDNIIMVKKGQLITSRKTLSEQTGIKQSTIERALKMLENEHQIEQRTTTKYRLITIVNWKEYQQADSKADNKRTASGQQADTNNNDNNNNNNNNTYRELRTPSCKVTFKSIDMELAILLKDLILNNNPNHKEPNLDAWANQIRLMRERDNKTQEQIGYVIKWSQNNNFWQSVILSTANLRKHFDKLVAQIRRELKTNQPKEIIGLDKFI